MSSKKKRRHKAYLERQAKRERERIKRLKIKEVDSLEEYAELMEIKLK